MGKLKMTGSNLKFLLPFIPAVLLTCVALPNTTITLAQSVAAGAFTPPVPSWASAFMRPTPVPVAFCRVGGHIRPTKDSDIKFEVWLPLSGWTGRYESVG